MESGDQVLAVGDGGEITERVEDPFAEEARAHRSEGAVDGTAETGAFGIAGLDEFQVGLGHGIEKEVGCGMPGFGGREVLCVAAEAPGDVVEESAGGADAVGEAGAA